MKNRGAWLPINEYFKDRVESVGRATRAVPYSTGFTGQATRSTFSQCGILQEAPAYIYIELIAPKSLIRRPMEVLASRWLVDSTWDPRA